MLDYTITEVVLDQCCSTWCFTLKKGLSVLKPCCIHCALIDFIIFAIVMIVPLWHAGIYLFCHWRWVEGVSCNLCIQQ